MNNLILKMFLAANSEINFYVQSIVKRNELIPILVNIFLSDSLYSCKLYEYKDIVRGLVEARAIQAQTQSTHRLAVSYL